MLHSSRIQTRANRARRLALALAVLVLPLTGAADAPEMVWWSVDGGGGVAAGGSYALASSTGQPDVGSCSASGYEMTGGFWSVEGVSTGLLFADGFETGTTTEWSATVP
jgi:hypothetical protein